MSQIDVDSDGWLKTAIRVLFSVGGATCWVSLLVVLVSSVWSPEGQASAPKEVAIRQLLSGATGLIGGTVGAASILVAAALKKRARWGWMGAVVVSLIYAFSCCFPFGAMILYTVMRRGFRRAYDQASRRGVIDLGR